YIPRPPNAFMLFRANFVRQKHVPGSIETNHGSLSKIIGNCWKALPEAEKKVWDARSKKAKAEHQKMYPNYRFRPVHNK
ncbi:high mobility group box domain-containing protein, partial [Irpex rosettiformis]